ncbi:MAG: GNAT family N-acetyltransferase [Burkholderiaceae bacterium]|nr:GNAT family N-acetyltransferase [Burkholderiaceae bacterium]
MERDEIRETVQAVIESIARGVDFGRIRADRPLREQVGLDSMDWLNLLDAFAERLSIEVPESDYDRLETLDATVDYLAARRATQSAHPTRASVHAPAQPGIVRHLIGSTWVTVRPIGPDDVALEAEFIRSLSDETRYQRFMATLREAPSAKLRALTQVDQQRDLAVAATVIRDGHEHVVGVARYGLDAAGTGCEFAIALADAWHGSGLAGILMRMLIDVARRRGLATMEGIVLATNRKMLELARQLGFRVMPDAQGRDTVRVVRSLQAQSGATGV